MHSDHLYGFLCIIRSSCQHEIWQRALDVEINLFSICLEFAAMHSEETLNGKRDLSSTSMCTPNSFLYAHQHSGALG